MTYVGTAELTGTIRQPLLYLRFAMGMRHAQTGQSLVDWCKQLPGRRWNPDVSAWEVNSVGPNPDRMLAAAGFEVIFPDEGELAGIVSLEQLYMPVTMLASNQRTVLVRPRFCGWEGTQKLIDNAGTWDKERGLIKMPVLDVVNGAAPRPGILWDQASIDRSYEMRSISPLLSPELGPHASALSNALDPKTVVPHLKAIQDKLGGPVGKFGVDLFPYQVIGAYGVAAGHTLLADSPGVGKAHPLTEPVLTPTGFRPMGDLRVGDKVVGSDGLPTTVLAVYPQGKLPIFKVHFDDGTFSRVTAEHLWQTVRFNGATDAVLSTEQIAERLKTCASHERPHIPLTRPVRFEGPGFLHDITDDHARTLGQWHAHELDTVAMPADPVARLHFLDGVLSSVGHFDWNSEYDYTSLEPVKLSVRSADAFVELVQSLGGTAEVRAIPGNPFFVSIEVGVPADLSDLHREPYHLDDCTCDPGYFCEYPEEGQVTWPAQHRTIVAVTPDGEEEAQCIRVEAADHLYLTRSYIVTHNTFQSLAAATALRSEKLLIVCPPVVTTNWAREVVKSGFATDSEIATYRTGRKEPKLDEARVVIVADSTLAARRHLIHHLSNWMNTSTLVCVSYDEAHRMKTMGSKRSDAVLDMAALSPQARRIAITGTPVLAGPHELVPILEFTGHLGPVFGGAGPFLEKYVRRDKFGGFHPKKAALPHLHRMLNEHVWMRRAKKDVLPFLPEKHITSIELDVDLKEYKRTHSEVIDNLVKILEQFRNQEGRWPNPDEIETLSGENIRFASQLRMAAGLTKVPYAIEMVSEWVKGNPDEPVLVWAHHKEVIAALHETAKKAKVPTGVIAGGISDGERMRLVDDFQAGKIPVLICSITAAGVGITLTRSSNAIFVESDWTPALMLQAMDRQHRIGQQRDVHAEILLALGTLDEHIQGTLAKKGETLAAILGDDSNSVAVGADRDLMNLAQVMEGLMAEACKRVGLVQAA